MAFNKYIVWVSLLIVYVFVEESLTDARRVGRGLGFCLKCGSGQGNFENFATISRCVLVEANTRLLNESLFGCECRRGFIGDGIICTDFDECSHPGDNVCDGHAKCTNTFGGYNCTCNIGWEGDGTRCLDIDECQQAADGRDLCNNTGKCINTYGSYICDCDNGFQPGNETACIDIDECHRSGAAGGDLCNNAGKCINTEGSYMCDCDNGLQPGTNGTACIAKKPTDTHFSYFVYAERVKILTDLLKKECPHVALSRQRRELISHSRVSAKLSVERMVYGRLINLLVQCRGSSPFQK